MKTKFIEAVKTGNVQKVKLLLNDIRVYPADNTNDAICQASEYGHAEVVKLLLNDDRVDPTDNNNFVIRRASKNGHMEVVRLLLADDRIDPTDNNNFAIRWASRKGHENIVKLLLNDDRIDPTDNNNYAIRWGSRKGHVEVVKLLLNDDRVDPSYNNNYAIHWASENNYIEIVKLLLRDDRVDWRLAGSVIKNNLIKDEKNILKNELITSYLSLERSSPQTTLGLEKGRAKSQIPKEIIKKMSYLGAYQKLCQSIHNSDIPSVKLVALANILGVAFDNKIKQNELCDKVKYTIFVSLL